MQSREPRSGCPFGKPRPLFRSPRLWGGACLGLPPRPVLRRDAWPFKADQAHLQVLDARGRGHGHVGRRRCGSLLRALWPPAPGAATPALAGLPPGTLPSGTRSPGTPSPGPLSRLFPGLRGHSGSAFLLLVSARA